MLDLKNLRVGIIGAGELGGAVARGLVKGGCKVTASCRDLNKHGELACAGVNLINNNQAVANGAD